MPKYNPVVIVKRVQMETVSDVNIVCQTTCSLSSPKWQCSMLGSDGVHMSVMFAIIPVPT